MIGGLHRIILKINILSYVYSQEEDYHVDARHLTIQSPPTGKYDLEIVTEILPQKNTSLEVNKIILFECCLLCIYCFFFSASVAPIQSLKSEDGGCAYLL